MYVRIKICITCFIEPKKLSELAISLYALERKSQSLAILLSTLRIRRIFTVICNLARNLPAGIPDRWRTSPGDRGIGVPAGVTWDDLQSIDCNVASNDSTWNDKTASWNVYVSILEAIRDSPGKSSVQ